MSAAPELHSATKEDILTALRTEAFTYARSMLFANAARPEERPHRDRRSVRVDRADRARGALRHARQPGGIVGDDDDNLRAAIEPESYEIEVMYPTFAEHATRATDTAAAQCFIEIRRHEIDHLEALREALIDIS